MYQAMRQNAVTKLSASLGKLLGQIYAQNYSCHVCECVFTLAFVPTRTSVIIRC